MKNIFAVIFCSVSLILFCEEPGLTEKDISGDWETIKGDYEYISLDIDGGSRFFGGYLEQRLMNSGTWELKNGSLILNLDNGHKVVYKKVSLKHGILDLNNGGEKYRRPRSAKEKTIDFLNELAAAAKIKFSGPSVFDFKWNSDGGNTIPVKGQMITTTVVIKNDFSDLVPARKSITDYLESRDFIMSDLNVSEIVSGYESGLMRVLIRIRTDEEAVAGSDAYIDIICGVIE